MSAASVLARGRAAAEALMVDSCSIRRKTGESTGPGGVVTPTYGDPLYAGKCRIQQDKAQAQQQDPGEAYVLMLRLEIQLPMSVTGLQAEDVVTITASAHDPDLVGRVFIVRDLAHASHKTARRVQVMEKTS
jgi:hypothetical protein